MGGVTKGEKQWKYLVSGGGKLQRRYEHLEGAGFGGTDAGHRCVETSRNC